MGEGKVELIKWALVSLAIPVGAGVHGHFQAQAIRDAEMARTDVELLLKLLPELNSTRAQQVEMARRIVFGLDRTSSASPSVKAMAVHLRELEEQNRKSGRLRDAALISEAEAQVDPSISPVPPVAAPSTTTIVETVATQLSHAPERVFIQIYAEQDRGDADAVREALREQGVAVPAIENVLASAREPQAVRRFAQRGSIAVRYFNASDRPKAEAVAGLIAGIMGTPPVGVQHVDRSRTKVPVGQLEIWFPITADSSVQTANQ